MRNMLRGGITFLAITAVFVVAECKKASYTNTAAPVASTDSANAAPTVAPDKPATHLPCMASTEKLCGPPCTITVDLIAKTADPDHAWLYRKQDVKWVAVGPKDGKLMKVHFAKTAGSSTKKSGDKLLKEAKCNTSGDCGKTFDDASDCVSYRYTVHGNHGEVIDPDVEIGTTTYPFESNVTTTAVTNTNAH